MGMRRRSTLRSAGTATGQPRVPPLSFIVDGERRTQLVLLRRGKDARRDLDGAGVRLGCLAERRRRLDVLGVGLLRQHRVGLFDVVHDFESRTKLEEEEERRGGEYE